jgi:xylulokinase
MFLGIDCGTQGTKAVLIDHAGLAHGRGHARHCLIEKPSGAREQQPEWWVEAMVSAVREALAEASLDPGEVKAIGVSGQQHGLVVLDEKMQCIRPAKLWNDTETSSQNVEILQRLGGSSAWFDRFGIIPLTGYTLSKLLWLQQREPENFARIRHILLPHDYLNYWLTGRLAAEFGDASGTAYFDVRRRAWATEPLAAIDGGSNFLIRALPEIIEADSIVGPLRPEAASALGLSTACLVSAGGGDNMMGAIGTGNVVEGVVTISLGTSSTIYSFSDHPIGDRMGRVAPFCSSTGGWLPLVCTMNATNVTARMLSLLGREVSYVSEALHVTQPGADGITFIPFLNGERTPDLPNAQGSIIGLSANNTTPANMMRATVEGVTYGVLAGLELILERRRPEQIQLIGGGARSEGWRQMIADITGSVIQVPAMDEAGCLGAAIQAMWAWKKRQGNPEPLLDITRRCVTIDTSKTAIPVPAKHALYESAISRYRDRLQQCYGVHN